LILQTKGEPIILLLRLESSQFLLLLF
jgi:hypothetical protein